MKFKNNSQRKAVMARYRNWNKQHSNFITPNVIKAKVSKMEKTITGCEEVKYCSKCHEYPSLGNRGELCMKCHMDAE